MLPKSIAAIQRARMADELLERLRAGETEPAPVDEVTTDLPVDAPTEVEIDSQRSLKPLQRLPSYVRR